MSSYSNKVKIRARRDQFFGDSVEFIGWIEQSRDNTRSIAVMQPVTLVSQKLDECGPAPTPFMVLDREAAQALMDELWSVGLRPSEGAGSAGSLAATERHLSDMRMIVAEKLGVALK